MSQSDADRQGAGPKGPDIDRRILTPVGYVIVALVPILIAAVGLTFLHFNYNPEDVVSGKRVPILASDWRAGDPAGTETIEGVLSLGDDDCVHLTASDGTDVAVVWPFDFEATYDPPRKLKLYDTDRKITARAGDTIRMRGRFADLGDYAGRPCAPAAGQVAIVESGVTVTARSTL